VDLRKENHVQRNRVLALSLFVLVLVMLCGAFLLALRHHEKVDAQNQNPPAATTAIPAKSAEVDRKIAKIEHSLGINKSGVGLSFKEFVDVNGASRIADDGKPLPVTNKHGDPLILEVLPNSPALAAGIATGDSVTRVNDVPTRGLSADKLVDVIRGEPGTRVTLTIVSDGKPRDVLLTRAPFKGMR
jgi:S1-C subfamily serine protease